jgi:hypothetical protein
MRRTLWSEAVRARQEVLLVDGFQDHCDCSLRYLVFECRDAERPLRTVRLGNVGSAYRRRLVAAGFDALQEVPQVGLKVRLVFRRRHSVDARRPILAGPYVGFSHPFEVDDMLQREQHCSRLFPCQFDYPLPFR